VASGDIGHSLSWFDETLLHNETRPPSSFSNRVMHFIGHLRVLFEIGEKKGIRPAGPDGILGKGNLPLNIVRNQNMCNSFQPCLLAERVIFSSIA